MKEEIEKLIKKYEKNMSHYIARNEPDSVLVISSVIIDLKELLFEENRNSNSSSTVHPTNN